MNTRDVIRLAVERMMDGDVSPEQACVDCPELINEVRAYRHRLDRVRADLDRLFPASTAGSSAMSSPAPAPAPPGYTDVEFIGRGGMGVVYRARHAALGRTVAIKMLLPGLRDGPEEAEALRTEASAVAALQHPNLIQVFEFGSCDGRPYFTMEYLEGGSLAQRTGGTPQPPHEAADLVARLSEAVHVAHTSGVVHRDIKPGNILFTAAGTPKLADFSLARRIVQDPGETVGGAGLGTPSYVAPEQAIAGSGRSEPGVDVYSLGAVLYDLLTGRPPFRADSPAETLRQVLEEDPASPSVLNRRVPRDLETICLTCLRKDPRRRYASALHLAQDLRRFLAGQPVHARPAGRVVRIAKLIRRHPGHAAAWVAGVIAVSALLSAGLWTASQRGAIERAVAQDLDAVVRLEAASDWAGARNILERAKTRLAAAGGARRLTDRAEAVEHELDLVHRLGQMRFERAAARTLEFDLDSWWTRYRDEFVRAGLLVEGEPPEAFAARVSRSPARRALVDAMDDWTICAVSLPDLQWLLSAIRAADPDPTWRDRARDIAIWNNPDALAALAREAPVESQPVSLLLIVAGRLGGARPDEAEALLRRVQAAHPSDFWANFALAEVLDTRQDAGAVGFLRAAISLRPEASAAHVNLGLALSKHGHPDEAIASMRRAIELDPDGMVAQHNLAVWLLQQGKAEESTHHARIATRLDPTQPVAFGVLGTGLLKLGRHAEAAEVLRTGLGLVAEGDPMRQVFLRALDECEAAMSAPPPPTP